MDTDLKQLAAEYVETKASVSAAQKQLTEMRKELKTVTAAVVAAMVKMGTTTFEVGDTTLTLESHLKEK